MIGARGAPMRVTENEPISPFQGIVADGRQVFSTVYLHGIIARPAETESALPVSMILRRMLSRRISRGVWGNTWLEYPLAYYERFFPHCNRRGVEQDD